MSAPAREYFTVDLRGLRAVLAKRAARAGVTDSDVLRSALAAALASDAAAVSNRACDSSDGERHAPDVKLSVRLGRPVARRLDQDARAAGLSRGSYLARLIQGAPPVASSADRVAACAALNRSSEELAVMSRDINHLTQLLRQGSVEAARSYAARNETSDRDVRSHLALASVVLTDLSSMRCHGQVRRTARHGSCA
jgi:hypothetical protein